MWRNDSALNDRGEQGQDLTGGYFDGKAIHTLYTQVSIPKKHLNNTSHTLNAARIILIVTKKVLEKKGLCEHISMNATACSCNILASNGETEYCILRELLGGWVGVGSENVWAVQGKWMITS
jgi:hypothetical protein